MPQKIKIIGLLKTDDYIQKEVDAVEATKQKLLKDSDWTQLCDSPLDALSILKWRHWRHTVRQVAVTADSLERCKFQLETLESSKPPSKTNLPYGSVVTKLDYSSVDGYRQSCIMVLKELLPNKSAYIKSFRRRARNAGTFDEVYAIFMETLTDGY